MTRCEGSDPAHAVAFPISISLLWLHQATAVICWLQKVSVPQGSGHSHKSLSRNMIGTFDGFNLGAVLQPRWGFCSLEPCLFFFFFLLFSFHKSAKLFRGWILKLEDAALKKGWIFYEGFWDFVVSKHTLQHWRLQQGFTCRPSCVVPHLPPAVPMGELFLIPRASWSLASLEEPKHCSISEPVSVVFLFDFIWERQLNSDVFWETSF